MPVSTMSMPRSSAAGRKASDDGRRVEKRRALDGLAQTAATAELVGCR